MPPRLQYFDLLADGTLLGSGDGARVVGDPPDRCMLHMCHAMLQKLEEAMGVAQHHDAVSGTAKQHVTFDYAQR